MTVKEFQRKSMLGIFLFYFKPHRKLFTLDMCCAFFIAAVDLAFPIVSRTAMNNMLPAHAYTAFFTVMGVVLAAYVVRSLLYYVMIYWGHTFGIRVEADIRRDLFSHVQTLSYGFFDQNRTGQLMSRLTNDLFEITELAHHGPEDLFISAVTIVGALIVMFTIQWRLALIVALMIPIFLFVLFRQRASMSSASRAVKQKTGAINAELESGLSGVRTAKAFASEDQELKKFDRANGAFKNSKRQFYQAMGRFNGTMEFFLSSLSVMVIAAGGVFIMRGEMNYIDLITFSLFITTFVNPVRKLANFAEMFANGFAGLERFVVLMRTEPALKDSPNAKELGRVRGEIDVDHVDFHYEDDDRPVLRDVSFHITPGETIAVVGASGGGKTSLCQLIPRFYDVSGGAIRIDGQDVREVTQTSLHRNIGIVQQDVFLFADTVLENIRYGTPGATMEQVVEAAKRAEIYDDIMAMPDGFDTYVGERGTLLSGGQKQRISIARIFLKDPPVLILDEATSALDSVTESRIQQAFDELSKGRTTLIIAHRLSTIRTADRILVISDGVIEEEGSHEALLKQGGAYAELYRTQVSQD
ncbi:MAG: ABC transporter ATP-binding protein [Oscillibacter sp.]|nr:ABC transporter ATP-binding protein [Oscillibacter sp.]